jgi:DNA polymerase I-like protein with 3'-5' exonuclease and polymerase domains
MTLSLMFVFSKLLKDENLEWVFQNIVMPLQHNVMLLEMHGAPLNIPKARQVEFEQTQIMRTLEPVIHSLAGKQFLVSSTEQLGKVLFEDLQLPGGSRNKKGWIVDAEVLKNITHPIVEPVLQYRRAQKISSTYATAALELVEEVSDDGKVGWVHPSYYLDSATGRLKCSDPNLTNLPRSENGGDIVKGMWEGSEDYRFVFMDESQIELRVIAHESGEPSWLEGFHAGYDMHAAMAKLVWKLPCTVDEVKTLYKDKRSSAKAVNFGIAYGESEYSLAQKLGITYEEAYHLVNVDYFGAAPVLKKWIDWVHSHAEAYGWVQNMFGRRRHLPDAQIVVPNGLPWPDKSNRPQCYRQGVAPYMIGVDPTDLYNVTGDQLKQLIGTHKQTRFFKCSGCAHLRSCFINSEVKYLEGKKARAMRQSVNTIIQGGAADMTSLALVWITQELQNAGLRSRPILYIHDEIGCYTHVDDVEPVKRIMEDCMTTRLQRFTNFRVPLLIDAATVKCWGDKH